MFCIIVVQNPFDGDLEIKIIKSDMKS